jgi:hypothetical protein
MLNCHDATQLMSQSLERKLTFGERVALKVHLTICGPCRNCAKQLMILRQAARRYARRPRVLV